MLDFASIFESHFFSNHHTQAKTVEATLEGRFPGYECVTFSSFAALAACVADEMCDEHTRMINVSERDQTRSVIESLNRFLAASTRAEIGELPENERRKFVAMFPPNLSPDVLLVDSNDSRAALLDFSYLHPMLEGAGIFVTSDAGLAEKIRWARCSYGHRAPSTVKIAANGRFSEFQAMLVSQSL